MKKIELYGNEKLADIILNLVKKGLTFEVEENDEKGGDYWTIILTGGY